MGLLIRLLAIALWSVQAPAATASTGRPADLRVSLSDAATNQP